MRKRRAVYWFVIIVLLWLNAFILIHRNEGYKYFPYKTYSEIYVTDSTLYLKDVNFIADTLQLLFSLKLPSATYKSVIDDSIINNPVIPADNALLIPLKDNIHTYKLIPKDENQTTITVQVDHDKSLSPITNEFIYCNLPGPRIKVSPFKIWTKGKNLFTTKEIKNADEFLRENTEAFSQKTDSGKLMELCKIISSLRPNPNGMKAGEASALSPFKQLQLAQQHKVNLNCGNYSAMLYFFCSIIGIPNRIVTFSGPAGNWQYGAHYYNEMYLREKQQWVLCDGLINAYMPHDSIRFYNAADVYAMAHLNSFKNKYVYTFDRDSLKELHYDSINYWHWYYNRSNASLRYWHPANNTKDSKWSYLLDFYSFNRDFDFYSNVNTNDWFKIIIKMAAFYLLIIVLVLYLSWEIKKH